MLDYTLSPYIHVKNRLSYISHVERLSTDCQHEQSDIQPCHDSEHLIWFLPALPARGIPGSLFYPTHEAMFSLRNYQPLSLPSKCFRCTEPESSLSCQQEPATGPSTEQMNPFPIITSYSSNIHFNIIFPCTLTSKPVPMLNVLSTKSWKRMGKWKYRHPGHLPPLVKAAGTQ
jgi:hypothetical protein